MSAEDRTLCRCEEVMLSEVLDAIRRGASDVDAVKRMTRAGMGLCQGNVCGRLVASIISRETGTPVSQIRLARVRIPVRPVSASVIAHCPLPETPP